tara:strand:+ start:12573 stop:13511 length:939 start_codon:yes stop_codon:yes gene_type:complete
MRDEFLWVEKYRPKTIDECILPENIKKSFQEFVDNKEIPNLLLTGSAGVGKTTVARALCEQMSCDYILINGSEESGIDVLRNKIKNFASTVSLSGGNKVVILDEADYLNQTSTQPALRGFIEEFSRNCRFILTCNFSNRIISPLHSRCSVVEFKIPKSQKVVLALAFMKRVKGILDDNLIKYNPQVVAELIEKYFPDWRRVLNELQRYSASGEIDVGILTTISDKSFHDLIDILKTKKFSEIRRWVADNLDSEPSLLYRKLYDTILEYVVPNCIPQTVLTIGDYTYKSAFVVDQEINTICCLLEIANQTEWS